MGKFLAKRLASSLITLWLLATIVFMIVNVLPGDVGRKVLGPFAPKEEVAAFNARLGTDKPLIQQYLTSIKNIFTLNFGESYTSGQKVTSIIGPALFRSGKLAILALVITVPLAIANVVVQRKRSPARQSSPARVPSHVASGLPSTMCDFSWRKPSRRCAEMRPSR